MLSVPTLAELPLPDRWPRNTFMVQFDYCKMHGQLVFGVFGSFFPPSNVALCVRAKHLRFGLIWWKWTFGVLFPHPKAVVDLMWRAREAWEVNAAV